MKVDTIQKTYESIQQGKKQDQKRPVIWIKLIWFDSSIPESIQNALDTWRNGRNISWYDSKPFESNQSTRKLVWPCKMKFFTFK